MRPGMGFQRVEVGHDQGADILAAVANGDELLDQVILGVDRFDPLRGNVLAARGDNQVFDAVGNAQEAVGVELTHVTGVEPAVAERLGRRFRLAIVPLGQAGAFDEYLAIGGDLHFTVDNGLAHRAKPERVGRVAGHHWRGFRQPIPLAHQQPGGKEELLDRLGQRRAAGREEVLGAADHRPHLAQHQPVGHFVLQAEQRPRRTALLQRVLVAAAHADRPVKQLLLER